MSWLITSLLLLTFHLPSPYHRLLKTQKSRLNSQLPTLNRALGKTSSHLTDEETEAWLGERCLLIQTDLVLPYYKHLQNSGWRADPGENGETET